MKSSFLIKTFFCFVILSSALNCASTEKANWSNKEITRQSSEDKAEKTSEFADSNFVVKSDGWEIPDVTKCRSVKRSEKKQLKPNANIYTECDSPIELENAGTMRVREIYEFEINEHKFCYGIVIGSPLVKSGDGKNVSMPGAIIYKTYYDSDGDGKFETLDKESRLGKLITPQWTQNQTKDLQSIFNNPSQYSIR